ncbi:MAG: hypothetical protein H6550_01430 [Chitinophagales bacterium]|nr:hypothetical protein [Chitinophagales bacterium]
MNTLLSKLTVTTLLIAAPILSSGKGVTESLVYIKNALLLNKQDVKGDVGITKMANTLQQGIGYNITRCTTPGVLLSSGIEAGYERYNANIKYPFSDYGFIKPKYPGDNYHLHATIPYIQLNINIGYRFTKKKYMPEFRIGQILHLPLHSKPLDYYSTETPINGLFDFNYEINGSFGKNDNAFVGELINYLYLGMQVPGKGHKSYRLGLQVQRKFFNNIDGFSSYRIIYYDKFGFERGREYFKGTHTSIGIVLGITI